MKTPDTDGPPKPALHRIEEQAQREARIYNPVGPVPVETAGGGMRHFLTHHIFMDVVKVFIFPLTYCGDRNPVHEK